MTKVKNVEHIVHKKSAVSGKTPTAAQLELGELAVNYNADEPFISFKDNADNIVKISPVAASDSPTAITVDNQNQQILLDVKKPDDTTVQLSGDAENIIFESDIKNGLEVDNHEVNIKIDSGSTSGLTVSQDGLTLIPDSAISSSSTNVVENKVLYEELDKKLDKVNFINNIYPKGSVYITYEYKNPSTFIGGEWELIGGEDASKNYYPAFAIDTDSAGTTINESLPNIKGSVALQSAFNNTFASNGAFTQDSKLFEETIDGAGARKRGTIYFNAHNSNSTYQDGAQVNVNAIKIFFWRRTDDGTIVEQIEPLDVDVKDILWQGESTEAMTITLSDSLDKYKQIEVTWSASTLNGVSYAYTDKVVEHILFPVSWDASVNRYFYFQDISVDRKSFKVYTGNNLKITMIRGVRAIPTTDIGVEVQDVLWEGATTAEASANLTFTKSALNYDELRIIAGNASTWNNNTQEKVLDLSEYRRIKAAGGGVLVAFAWDSTARFINGFTIGNDGTTCTFWCSGCSVRKVIGVKRPHISTISAGDGINVSESGAISVAPLQKVTCTKTSLIGNEFYFGGEYYPALKTVHIHGGFAPTTSIGNGSGICRLTIGSQQVVFDDNVIGYVMCNNNATYPRFCQSTKDSNQITARDLTIETGRFYWLDLFVPAHLA